MSQGTLYALDFPRTVVAKNLVSHFNLDVKVANEIDDAYKANFPLHKFPTFIGPKGYKLHEVIAILTYLTSLSEEAAPLYGKTEAEKAEVLKWLSLSTAEFLTEIAAAFKPLIGALPYNKKQVTDANATVDAIAAVFEERLTNYTYLVGERITLADLFGATCAWKAYETIWGKEWIKQHPSFTRWFKTVIAHPILAEHFKDFQFIEKPIEYTPSKKEKKEQPKAAPKAAPKPAAAKEEKPAEEKKPKHPLELLGKSTKFDLDQWKRTYSNEETRETALPWFWEHYDPSEWSLWRVDYKYNDELTLTFMSNNLVGGFFNRLSSSSKYLFGSAVVYGESNNNGIVGVFLVRGQEHEPAFDVAPDWESYSFTKLDATKPEDKAFVEDIFAWDKPISVNGEAREVADGQVFK